MRINQFNDRTWIHSILRHFIVIPNELTSGTDVSRLSRALLKSFSKGTTSSTANHVASRRRRWWCICCKLARPIKRRYFSPKAPRSLERQVEQVTSATRIRSSEVFLIPRRRDISRLSARLNSTIINVVLYGLSAKRDLRYLKHWNRINEVDKYESESVPRNRAGDSAGLRRPRSLTSERDLRERFFRDE